MQRVFLIHGWTGNPEKDFLPWAKNELQKSGYEVFAPEMPDTDNPKIAPWVEKIRKVVGEPKRNDIFIGHSIGCQAVERYLQTLPADTRIDKVILVAPWVVLKPETFSELESDKEVVKPWYRTPIDYAKIKEMASWTAVFSDDDPFVKYEDNYKVYKDKLGAKIILEKGEGHFSAEQGVNELPFLLELVK